MFSARHFFYSVFVALGVGLAIYVGYDGYSAYYISIAIPKWPSTNDAHSLSATAAERIYKDAMVHRFFEASSHTIRYFREESRPGMCMKVETWRLRDPTSRVDFARNISSVVLIHDRVILRARPREVVTNATGTWVIFNNHAYPTHGQTNARHTELLIQYAKALVAISAAGAPTIAPPAFGGFAVIYQGQPCFAVFEAESDTEIRVKQQAASKTFSTRKMAAAANIPSIHWYLIDAHTGHTLGERWSNKSSYIFYESVTSHYDDGHDLTTDSFSFPSNTTASVSKNI